MRRNASVHQRDRPEERRIVVPVTRNGRERRSSMTVNAGELPTVEMALRAAEISSIKKGRLLVLLNGKQTGFNEPIANGDRIALEDAVRVPTQALSHLCPA